ncbi:MAG: zinc ribbon domain-containing protein [Capsulimonas sp.]|uniref:zinc ribbon domain-containing protein n=1 Tax=Capsulimonas sp. TaxID=2494211 RepID=UPI0032675691
MNGSMWRAIRAIVWKEWRENAGWALLAALGLSLGVLYNVTQKYQTLRYVTKDFTGYWEGIHTVMAVGPLVVAVGIAFIQIFSEQRRDQWAFLIHRPASRGVLFWGKALAGLSLVLAATATPLLGAAVWAAIPGHLAAPFDLDLCSVGFRGIAVASLAYFGALLTALRPAHWYGSRLLPVILAVLCAFLIAQGISLFFLPPLAFVLGAAAWGAFLGDGDDARQPVIGKIGLRLTLYAVLLAVSLGAVAAIDSAYRSMYPAAGATTMTNHFVIAPNHIVQSNYVLNPGTSMNYRLVDTTGVDGKQYPVDPRTGMAKGEISNPSSLSIFESVSVSDVHSQIIPIAAYQETTGPDLKWFYVRSRNWVEVYSQDSRRLVGRFGLNGYVPVSSGAPEPFRDEPVALPSVPVLDIYTFRHRIYRMVSFDAAGRFLPIEQRRFQLLFQEPEGTQILSIARADQIQQHASLAYIVTTNAGLQVLGGDGSLLASLPWTKRDFTGLSVDCNIVTNVDRNTLNPDHYFFWFWPADRTKAPITADVVEVAGNGKIAQRAQVTEPAYHHPADTPWFGIGTPLPAVALAAHSVSGADKSVGDQLMVIAFVTALLCAPFGWLIGVRCAVNRRACFGWALACFILGVPSLLTLIALRSWPARVSCPACGMKRIVDHERCEHCGAPFPPPARDGTEIMDTSETAAHAA